MADDSRAAAPRIKATFTAEGQTTDIALEKMLAKIEELGCRGVIFDCDGTLVESARAHCLSMQAAAREQGFEMTDAWYGARTGLDRRSLFTEFLDNAGEGFEVEMAVATSIRSFARFVELVEPIPSVMELFKTLKSRGLALAVATNAEREIAEQTLTRVGVLDDLDALTTISDGVPPKPSPAVFEFAAQRLGLGADAVCVIEDSPQGVRAAEDAGMPVFALTVTG